LLESELEPGFPGPGDPYEDDLDPIALRELLFCIGVIAYDEFWLGTGFNAVDILFASFCFVCWFSASVLCGSDSSSTPVLLTILTREGVSVLTVLTDATEMAELLFDVEFVGDDGGDSPEEVTISDCGRVFLDFLKLCLKTLITLRFPSLEVCFSCLFSCTCLAD
jgi:hypothetical protein